MSPVARVARRVAHGRAAPAPTAAPAPPVGRGTVATVVLLTLAALAVRLPAVLGRDMWIDEAATLALAQRDLGEQLALLQREANGILYQLLVLPLVPLSEAMAVLRLPALAGGVLAVPAAWWVGRRIIGDGGAVVAAAVMAVSPMDAGASASARPGILVVPLSLLAVGALIRAADGDGRRWWVVCGAATALAAYSNLLSGLLLLIPQAAVVLLLRRRALGGWLRTCAGLAVALVPLAVLILDERDRRDPFYWLTAPSAGDLAGAVRTMFGGTAALAAVLLAAAAAVAWRRHRGLRPVPDAPTAAALALWAFGPTLVLFAVAQVTPVFQPRYAIVALPGVCLLVGWLVARLPPRAALALTLAVVATGLRGTGREATRPTDEWRAAAASLAAVRAPGDPVVVDTFSGLGPLGYYDRRYAAAGGDLVNAEWRDRPVPPRVVLLDDPGGYGRLPAGPPSVGLVRRLLGRTGRVHVVLSAVGPSQGEVRERAGLAWARARCSVRERDVTGVAVLTISACGPARP